MMESRDYAEERYRQMMESRDNEEERYKYMIEAERYTVQMVEEKVQRMGTRDADR